jgi:phosphoadenosine phosphosulfate reductase
VSDITTDTQLQHEVADATERFERVTPDEIIAWTFERFGDDVVYACSFEDVALLHMIWKQRPRTEVIFLDTLGHFAATYAFVDAVERDWSLTLTRTAPGPDADAWPCGTAECCQRRKVAPLAAAVAGHAAWFTSVKRVDSETRSAMPIVSVDAKFGLVKVNPLATWTDDDVAYYLQREGLPTHPLWADGYTSIGCEPVTVKPLDGADRRSGRWSGSDKDECGLHDG